MRNRAQFILILLILLTVTFIWGNSLGSASQSHSESKKALEYVKPVLEPIVGTGTITNSVLRKIAHFVEFGVLGCEFAALHIVRTQGGFLAPRRVSLQGVANCLFAGLSVAVIDETIQIFSKRGSQVQDVLLDFGGVCAGLAFVLLINWFVSAFRASCGKGMLR